MLSLLSGIFILYRKPDDDTAAATDSIIYLKRSVMERYDLVTYGKADTGAPVFRAALIKLLLDMREFILGYAPAVVSYDNDRVLRPDLLLHPVSAAEHLSSCRPRRALSRYRIYLGEPA